MDENLPEHTALTSDFSAWEIENPKKIICSGKSVTEDGRLVFNLSIDDTKFRLLCPANYPNHEDSFFMETECTDFWCIALNEFIIDSPKKLTLDIILAKTFLYYTPSLNKSYDSSENESENENENYCDLRNFNSPDTEASEIEEWESMISKKKIAWRKKEGELRLRYNRPKIMDMFDGRIMDHPQQVFSNSAASEILINDLINIIGSRESHGIVVDTVDNDICRWSVFFKDFYPTSDITKDLRETKDLYGYDDVQLQLDFTMDFYPSYPPVIKFIRPKLVGIFDAKEFVKLANWNPARNMMSVLKEIKDYIDSNARIDIEHKRNGIKVGIVQKILTELADTLKAETNNDSLEKIMTKLLHHLKSSDLESKCILSDNHDADSYYTFNLTSNNNVPDKKSAEPEVRGMDRSMGDVKLEIQNRFGKQRRAETTGNRKQCNIITNPAFGLRTRSQDLRDSRNEKYSLNGSCAIRTKETTSTCSDKNIRNISDGSKRRNKTCIECINHSVVSSYNVNSKIARESSATAGDESTLELNKNLSRLLNILEESVLLPFFRSKLAVDVFFMIWQSTSLYRKIIEVLFELASSRYFVDLLSASDISDQSIADLLKIQEKSMRIILEKLADLTDGRLMKQADLDKAELARSIIDASKFMESQLTKHCSGKHSSKVFCNSNNQIPGSSASRYRIESLDSVHVNYLRGLTFRDCNIDLETHTFKNDYIRDMNSSKNYFRMAQEFAALATYLPLELKKSAIFVRVDNSKPSLMRALITGAEGTCCGGGCFIFDIYLRKDYPDGGLEIRCVTFGDEEIYRLNNNRITFPTFEDDAFPPDLTKPRTKFSNILQVLIFIQNRRLIPLEIFDENQQSRDSQESGLKEMLLRKIIQFTMIDQIRKPAPGFEEVIATHFRIKKDQILSELEQYDFLKNSALTDSLKKELHYLTINQEA